MTTPYIDPNSIHVPSVGASPPASWGATVRNNFETLARSPGCVLNRPFSAAWLPGGGAWTPVQFTAADLRDTDNYHSPSSSPERITIPPGLSGWYGFAGGASFGGNASGIRQSRFLVNGSQEFRQGATVGGLNGTYGPRLMFSDVIRLIAGDYVEVQLVNSSGVTLDVAVSFAMTLLAWS